MLHFDLIDSCLSNFVFGTVCFGSPDFKLRVFKRNFSYFSVDFYK